MVALMVGLKVDMMAVPMGSSACWLVDTMAEWMVVYLVARRVVSKVELLLIMI
jgi:hypothetical protein